MNAHDLNPWGWRSSCALYVPPLAWALHHQIGSNIAFAACERAPHVVAIVIGLIGIGLIAISGAFAWGAWRRANRDAHAESESLATFVPLLGIMNAALFALPIAAQLIADIVLPPCLR
jgi:TRAP-type C4-dicarboxylate transport system permease small subunit